MDMPAAFAAALRLSVWPTSWIQPPVSMVSATPLLTV